MFRREASIQNILRSLKKPTKLDEIIDSVPKPKGAVPSFGLPRWKIMPLETKLPLVPAPSGTYCFTRNKIGQKLFYDSRKGAEFNLNDPYNHDIDYSYDPLHDENLANYFTKKSKLRQMIQRGFITKNLDVICNIKQYNLYRKYQQKIYADSIKKHLYQLAKIRDDRRVLEMAEREAQKDFIRIQDREKKSEVKSKIYLELVQQEEEKRKKRDEKAAQVEKRLKLIEIQKKENIQKIVLKAKLHTENVKQKRAMMKEKDRKKIVNMLLKTAKREKKRRKIRQERLRQEADNQQKINQEKWRQKYQFQEIKLAEEQYILQYAEQQRNRFITNYKKKVNKERERMKDKIKKAAIFNKCYTARHAGGGKRVCCKIPKRRRIPKGTKKQSRSIDDLCRMTENCKCDEPGTEYCEDQSQL